jgi:hypothetical protein
MLGSASKIDVLMSCLGSAVLPHADETNDDAEHGTSVHGILLDVNRLGREAALAKIEDADMRAVAQAIDFDRLPVDPSAYAAEVALSWSIVTGGGRELHRGGGRDYSMVGAMEFAGTADVIGLTASAVITPDYKTGHAVLVPANRHRQMRFLGLAAARAYGRDTAIVELIRLDDDGRAWRDRAELDVFDLAEVAEEMRDLGEHIHAARLTYEAEHTLPKLSVGGWCRRCSSRRYCPAQVGLIVAAQQSGALVRFEEQALTEEGATTALEQYQAVKDLEELMGKIIRGIAYDKPIRQRNGLLWGRVVEERETLSGAAVFHVVKERFDEETAWKTVKLSATKEAIRDLAAYHADKTGQKRTHVEREILNDIRSREGGAKKTPIEKYRAFKPPKESAR